MQYVRYVGAAHRRVISASDWRSARLTGDQVVWEAQNGFAVPLDLFTEKQIETAIKPDPDLVITGEDEEFQPTPRPVDMTPRELAYTLENQVDLVAVLNGDAPAPAGISGASTGASAPADAAPNGNVRNEEERRQLVDGSHLDEDDEDR